MKTSKAAPQSSSQEECGVWLDTVQLKEKVKQKRLAPPISKLLNPLTEGGGYRLAVALNFTQTKMEMPKTKQSSISAFFTPKQKVLRKLSSTEAPTPDPARPSSPSTTTEPSTVSSLRKRTRESSNSDLEKEDMAETKATARQDERSSRSALLKRESVEWKLPPCKRRPHEPSLLPNDSQTSLQPWSRGSLLTCSEDSEELSSDGSSFLDGVQNSEGFANLIDERGKTSTQKPAENYSPIKDEKENSRLVSYKSPSKCISLSHLGTLSNRKWAELKNTSPQKQPEHSGNHLVKGGHFNLSWRRSSPFKKQQKCSEADEASLATLFTQDSEGFRVIAHRGLQTRSPLKDQSNLSTGSVRSCAYKPVVKEEEEEDEMLFTQDSQGNMVIKH
ncbi:aurora kinase A and ninein-interacting protein [Fundulus heteroclitus]|uniref:aurora kinase A and ninein-interacting protein n=1 Tax=Fundulus heteroclitus TaxID=8078 RepID=UPI00165C5BCD|nr:aurora kinase A and ninein-interacting protein [Fundulus heteroclitus]